MDILNAKRQRVSAEIWQPSARLIKRSERLLINLPPTPLKHAQMSAFSISASSCFSLCCRCHDVFSVLAVSSLAVSCRY